MRSHVTSYAGLFVSGGSTTAILRVEIPLYQRDYAQGRGSPAAQRIRKDFLKALHAAVTAGTPISLDFIYGDVEEGVLRPLDGQQRLTTLFLLHWYLARRAGTLDPAASLWNFSYATRARARLFCERLIRAEPDFLAQSLQDELRDRPWFLPWWDQDPTISSMLVMLEDIHGMFHAVDHGRALAKLIDPQQPVIVFHLLAEPLGSSEQLYIKINSRGKPLTEFENFKAQLEKALGEACPDKLHAFAHKVDGAWTDVFWPYRGAEELVDDEFLRYFSFVTDLTWWRHGGLPGGDLLDRALGVYGKDAAQAAGNVDFLNAAFDVWVNQHVSELLAGLFTVEAALGATASPRPVRLFGSAGTVDTDLSAACCRHYVLGGRSRHFGWQHALLLHAVIVHRVHRTPDVHEHFRVLRNVMEASEN